MTDPAEPSPAAEPSPEPGIGDGYELARVFEHERPRLRGIAYRMLGTADDADDIVQDAWLRFATTSHRNEPEKPEAWLTTVVTRLALDRLKSAQHRRESYVGPWLPEPVLAHDRLGLAAADTNPEEHLLLLESLSVGFLAILERLSPLERAAFLLHDVFGLSMGEVAITIERSETATRQLAKRAREHVQGKPRYVADPADVEALSDAFFTAAVMGDMEKLESMLHVDAIQVNDGGPRFRASRYPVVGRARVARFIISLMKKAPPGVMIHRVQANGQFAYYLRNDDHPFMVLAANWADGKMVSSYGIRNEDKLVAFERAWQTATSTRSQPRSETRSEPAKVCEK